MNNVTTASSSFFSSALATHGGIALGLGLTNECNLKCAFCYRDPTRTDRLSLDQVKSVLERLPIRSASRMSMYGIAYQSRPPPKRLVISIKIPSGSLTYADLLRGQSTVASLASSRRPSP